MDFTFCATFPVLDIYLDIITSFWAFVTHMLYLLLFVVLIQTMSWFHVCFFVFPHATFIYPIYIYLHISCDSIGTGFLEHHVLPPEDITELVDLEGLATKPTKPIPPYGLPGKGFSLVFVRWWLGQTNTIKNIGALEMYNLLESSSIFRPQFRSRHYVHLENCP